MKKKNEDSVLRFWVALIVFWNGIISVWVITSYSNGKIDRLICEEPVVLLQGKALDTQDRLSPPEK